MTFTFFFRDIDALISVAELVVPIAKERKRVRIWDAGSSKGCEPFSFGILLKERLTEEEFDKLVFIDTSDIDENGVFEKIINSGIYPIDDLKRIPKDIFAKHFSETEKKGHYKINDKILQKVKFYHNDLRDLQPIRTDYKLIICKNVLLHIKQNEQIEVLKMFHASMEKGGYLTTEISQKLPKEAEHLFEKIMPNLNVYRKIG